LPPTRRDARNGEASNKRMDIDNDIAVQLDLAALRKLIKRVAQDEDGDDARDVRWWKEAFKVLKPPPRDDT
jgi:hypothetical protein